MEKLSNYTLWEIVTSGRVRNMTNTCSPNAVVSPLISFSHLVVILCENDFYS